MIGNPPNRGPQLWDCPLIKGFRFGAVLLGMCLIGLNGCSESASDKEKALEQAQAESQSDKSNSNKNKSPNQNDADGSDSDQRDDSVFGLFCHGGQETRVGEKFAKYFAAFCEGNQPKDLLTKDLIADAYDGKGDPGDALHFLLPDSEFDHDPAKKTSRTHVALAIELPISAERHFNEKGPIQGDPEQAGKVGLFPENAEVEIEVLETRHKDGKYHVRGWSNDTKSTTSILGAFSITTHVVAEDDQWELEPGKAYMFTSYLSKSIDRIKVANLLTASVQVGEKAYLITQADAIMANDGLPSIAESQIKAIAEELVANMYDVADE